MRTSTALSVLALAAAPALVTAAGTLGFCLGDVVASGACKKTADYEADFKAIKSASGSTLVRIYAASACNTAQQILPAAKSMGFQVVLGVWPDTDESLQADKAAIQEYAPQYQDQIYAVTVGSETLYRGNFTGEQLLEKINEVKAVLPDGMKIGTADSWDMYQQGKADAVIKGGVDILLANGFSYWQGIAINNASHSYLDDMDQALNRIQSISGSIDAIEFWTGETGWPGDGGSTYENVAVASDANAKTFWDEGVCAALAWGTNVFYFEAFDEPSKPTSVGEDGQAEVESTWGAFTVDRTAKWALTC